MLFILANNNTKYKISNKKITISLVNQLFTVSNTEQLSVCIHKQKSLLYVTIVEKIFKKFLFNEVLHRSPTVQEAYKWTII